MIRLPPGCTINYEITIQINELPDEMLAWTREVGGKTSETGYYDAKGKQHIVPVVQFGTARPSYKTQDGTGNFLLRFKCEDAPTALMFLMKFSTYVVSHNMREVENYVY